MIVVDTSVIVYVWFPGDRVESVIELIKMDSDWHAPFLWRSEFRSFLAGQLRGNRISLETARSMIAEAENFFHGKEHLVASADILELVSSSSCSAYDCEFVALAKALRVPLVTADQKIVKAFPRWAVGIADYVK